MYTHIWLYCRCKVVKTVTMDTAVTELAIIEDTRIGKVVMTI